jgi:transcriptional regulator with XRE-family HTH domain
MSDPFQYPGDDVMCKALGEALKKARLEAGLSIEEAEERSRVAMEGLDQTHFQGAGSRHQRGPRETPCVPQRTQSQCRTAPEKIDRARTWLGGDMPVTEFFRISYALKMKPDELTERFEEIEKNIAQGVIHRE